MYYCNKMLLLLSTGIQIMRKFSRDKHVLTATFPEEMAHFTQLSENAAKPKGTLLEMTIGSEQYSEMIELGRGDPFEVNFTKTSAQVPLSPLKRKALEQIEMECLKEMYKLIYACDKIRHVSSFCQSFNNLLYAGSHYRSDRSNDDSASIVTAKWLGEMKRPAIVREFMLHDVVLVDENNKAQRITHVLAYVQWYTHYFGTNIYSYPIEIWANKFEPYSNFSYMPVGRIQQKCVAVKATLKGNNQREKINVIIPLPSATRL